MGKDDKVLVLARREDLKNYAMQVATGLGFEAYGALDNDEAKALLEDKKHQKHPFCACVLGNVFVNGKYFKNELQESASRGNRPAKITCTLARTRSVLC